MLFELPLLALYYVHSYVAIMGTIICSENYMTEMSRKIRVCSRDGSNMIQKEEC